MGIVGPLFFNDPFEQFEHPVGLRLFAVKDFPGVRIIPEDAPGSCASAER